MADAPAPITSAPAQPHQPWDATSTGSAGPWKSLDANAGSCNINTGACSGDHFGDSPPFRQT